MLKIKWCFFFFFGFFVLPLAYTSQSHRSAFAQGASAEVPPANVAEYGAVADRAIAALMKGDAAAFKALLSPGTVKMEQRGPAAIDTIIEQKFIPFFKEYAKPGASQQVFKTYRAIDNVKGVGLARSFTAQDGPCDFL